MMGNFQNIEFRVKGKKLARLYQMIELAKEDFCCKNWDDDNDDDDEVERLADKAAECGDLAMARAIKGDWFWVREYVKYACWNEVDAGGYSLSWGRVRDWLDDFLRSKGVIV